MSGSEREHSLGDRMKSYEAEYRHVLPRQSYTVIRVDIRAAHGLLCHAKKPFDEGFVQAMNNVAIELCKEFDGAKLAYVQSDEISVLLTDLGEKTEPWFGGVLQKMASIAAATASVQFNEYVFEYRNAVFDGRVFTVPDKTEAMNYFLWRQRDCLRNSVSMVAQSHFSHKQLYKKNTSAMLEMLEEKGVNWAALDMGVRRGRVAVKKSGVREFTYFDQQVQDFVVGRAERTWWEAEDAPQFLAEPGSFLDGVIPDRPKE